MATNHDPTVIPMIERHLCNLPETNTSDPETLTEEAVLSFHNISYRETVQSGFPLRKKTQVIERLSNINGIMKPGLNAIMGPQDGSRSLLLDVLAARSDPCGLSGDILINGKPRPTNFKCTSAYVPQNDVVLDTVTVRDNLEFSAALRLPMTVTRDEKRKRIDEVLELLHLEKEQNIKPRCKEVRKRTSIAMELITEHPIVFLDDPTTGLDLGTTTDIISILRGMSKKGRTIIFSISQPQYSIFRFFDSLTLVASGKVMFHGPAQDALEYFTSAGYKYESHNNPADFFLDIINGGFSDTEEECQEADEHKGLFERQYQVKEKLANMYTQSPLHRDTRTQLDQLLGEQNLERSSALETTCVTPFWHQLRWTTWRSFQNYKGFPWVTVIQVFQTLRSLYFGISVIKGAFFLSYFFEMERFDVIRKKVIINVTLAAVVGTTFRLLQNVCTELQTRAVLILLLTGFQCITSVSAGELFVIDRDRFLHEHSSGYYTVSSYFFGKLLAELIPRRLLPSTVFTLITYVTAGLRTSVKVFFTMAFTIMMLAYSASSLSLSLGAGENVAAITTLLMIIYFVFMLCFAGLSLDTDFLPVLSWIQYLSIPHYGFRALLHNEFLGQNFCPEHNTEEVSRRPNYVICTGEEFLEIQGFHLSSWGFWENHLALVCIMIILLIITYVQLLPLKKRIYC